MDPEEEMSSRHGWRKSNTFPKGLNKYSRVVTLSSEWQMIIVLRKIGFHWSEMKSFRELCSGAARRVRAKFKLQASGDAHLLRVDINF